MLTGPTGKPYIGITINGVGTRWRGHCTAASRGKSTAIARAIRKYGSETFVVRELVHTSWEELLRLEPLAIEAYATLSPSGYNLVSGGRQPMPCEDTRVAMSQAATKRYQDVEQRQKHRETMKNWWALPETREKMQVALKGRVCSEDKKRKISQAMSGRKLSEIHKRRISDAHLRRNQ